MHDKNLRVPIWYWIVNDNFLPFFIGGISNSNDIFKENLQQMTFARKNNVIALVCMRLYISTRFLKTNLTTFAVIWVKRRQKAGFLSPISSKITVTKEKEEKEKERATGRSRRRREKSNGCTLRFYNSYFGVFCPKKQVKKECLTQKVHLAIKFSKIRPDMYF